MPALKRSPLPLLLALSTLIWMGTDEISCGLVTVDEAICILPVDCNGLAHTNLDCKAEWDCVVGVCVWDCVPLPPDPDTVCYQNLDCQAGEACYQADGCCPPPDCPPGGECAGDCVPCGQCGVASSECLLDLDCPPGFGCETLAWCPPCLDDDVPCAEPCQEVSTCVAGPDECTLDEQCEEGFHCAESKFCPYCLDNDPHCLGDCEKVRLCMINGDLCEPVVPGLYGDCVAVLGVAFIDGDTCNYVGGCDCGEDCDRFYPNIAACEEACLPPKEGKLDEPCETLDPYVFGDCQVPLGWGWVGDGCTVLSGCGCGGDCHQLYETQQECESICTPPDPVELPPCGPVQPGSFGACPTVLGYGLVAGECTPITGCSVDYATKPIYKDQVDCIELCL